MIELLGVGVPDGDGGWWLHRACARLRSGQLIAVVSSRPEERRAMLDAVSGRVVPLEGRVWVRGVPVMTQALRRVRMLVADVHPGAPLAPGRTVLWNALAAATAFRGTLAGVLRFPRLAERQAAQEALEAVGLTDRVTDIVGTLGPADRLRLAIARALVRRPEVLVVRDPDGPLGVGDAAAILEQLRAVAGLHSLAVLVSLVSMALACERADRLVVINEGSLIYEGSPTDVRQAPPSRLEAFLLAGR